MLCGLDDGGLADLTAALSLSGGSCGEALVLLAGTPLRISQLCAAHAPSVTYGITLFNPRCAQHKTYWLH